MHSKVVEMPFQIMPNTVLFSAGSQVDPEPDMMLLSRRIEWWQFRHC